MDGEDIQVANVFVTDGGLQFERRTDGTIKIIRPGVFEEVLTESEWASAKSST